VNQKIKAVTTAPNYNILNGVNQTVPGYDAWEIEDPA
jgi:stage V sporulation protein SpoVS